MAGEESRIGEFGGPWGGLHRRSKWRTLILSLRLAKRGGSRKNEAAKSIDRCACARDQRSDCALPEMNQPPQSRRPDGENLKETESSKRVFLKEM